MKITISCSLCRESLKTETQIPDTWSCRVADIEDALCPKHKVIEDFIDSQCPGCVGSWANCDLWSDFAYSGRRNLHEEDFTKIRNGICPRRVNGTFGMDNTGPHEIDLSEKPPSEAGVALETAIKAYWAIYE